MDFYNYFYSIFDLKRQNLYNLFHFDIHSLSFIARDLNAQKALQGEISKIKYVNELLSLDTIFRYCKVFSLFWYKVLRVINGTTLLYIFQKSFSKNIENL